MKRIYSVTLLAVAIVALSYVLFFRNEFADKIFPKLQRFILLQPVGANSESDDKIVYYINDLYLYDSTDIIILKDILNDRSIYYLVTTQNEILIPEDLITVESLFFIENLRQDKKRKWK